MYSVTLSTTFYHLLTDLFILSSRKLLGTVLAFFSGLSDTLHCQIGDCESNLSEIGKNDNPSEQAASTAFGLHKSETEPVSKICLSHLQNFF